MNDPKLLRAVGDMIDRTLAHEMDEAWRRACADVIAATLAGNVRRYGADIASKLSPSMLLRLVLDAKKPAQKCFEHFRHIYCEGSHPKCRCRQDCLVIAASRMTGGDEDDALTRLHEYLDARS